MSDAERARYRDALARVAANEEETPERRERAQRALDAYYGDGISRMGWPAVSASVLPPVSDLSAPNSDRIIAGDLEYDGYDR